MLEKRLASVNIQVFQILCSKYHKKLLPTSNPTQIYYVHANVPLTVWIRLAAPFLAALFGNDWTRRKGRNTIKNDLSGENIKNLFASKSERRCEGRSDKMEEGCRIYGRNVKLMYSFTTYTATLSFMVGNESIPCSRV